MPFCYCSSRNCRHHLVSQCLSPGIAAHHRSRQAFGFTSRKPRRSNRRLGVAPHCRSRISNAPHGRQPLCRFLILRSSRSFARCVALPMACRDYWASCHRAVLPFSHCRFLSFKLRRARRFLRFITEAVPASAYMLFDVLSEMQSLKL